MTSPLVITVATGNSHKLEEFAAISRLLALPITWQSAKTVGGMPPVDENGADFLANARIKAQALRELLPTPAWVLADDSGLEVDALGGAPGIYSARYAGPGASDVDNYQKLLAALRHVPPASRGARFVCWLALIDAQGNEVAHYGECRGRILETPSGQGGFGYDPLFVPDGYSETYSVLADTVKHQISHRARAMSSLAQWLRDRR
ncbi:MAG: RdgB/HAM1 family non-canonical purine NTP pyrophosphatase [Verrucomicrobiota bacterium]|nr:RdgB/HAM1 family non-canonical purine NTP pyrophosphatase [Verrucomicrobiota bacterium]